MQVREHVRDLINRREIAPGTRLPTIRQLAKQWDTNHYTIHMALTPLANEGLIECPAGRRSGMQVRGPSVQITAAAIYSGSNLWADPENSFYQHLYRDLERELDARHIRSRLFLDARKPAAQFSPWPEMSRAVNKREVQGVIGMLINSHDVVWLKKLGIPFSLLFSYGHDVVMEAYVKPVLDRLIADGCQSVGMIVRSPQDNYASFEKVVTARGLKTCPAWLKQQYDFSENIRQEEFGYRSFHEIWASPNRPDGLFIFPDWICRGAITAILELGVRVPQDLRLMLFRNSGLDYICPWKVPMMVADVRQTAVDLIDHLLTQHQSGPADPVIFSLPSKLVG